MGQFTDYRRNIRWVVGNKYQSDPLRNAMLALYIDHLGHCVGNIKHFNGFAGLEKIW